MSLVSWSTHKLDTLHSINCLVKELSMVNESEEVGAIYGYNVGIRVL